MHFQLLKVVLWSRSSEFAPRKVEFQPGMVNVVMGVSRTGKSALIPIIDYCLGSGKCAVPKKVVRAACSWFGIVIDTAEGEKLLARKEPGEQDAIEDMFILEGAEVEVPSTIPGPNASTQQVKRKLDQLAGLPHLGFAGGASGDSLDHRPSFRDLMAFVFQPQNVVANPDVLFYRTDQLKHRVKLAKNILPFVLNAVSPEILAAQNELERLRRAMRRKERDLEAAQAATSRWESEISGHLSHAAELGLIEPDAELDLKPDAMLELLRKVARRTVDDFKADSSTITSAVEELARLDKEEAKLSDELAILKDRQVELSRLREGAGGYREALQKQSERLAITDWLIEQAGPSQCPICGGSLEHHHAELEILKRNLREIEVTASKLEAVPVAIDREVYEVREGTDAIMEKFARVRRQKKALTGSSEEARQRQFQSLGVAHFLGQLRHAIAVYDETHDGGELSGEIAELGKKIEELEKSIDEAAIAKRQASAVERVGSNIAQFMPQLDNDHPNDPAQLVVEDLTLKINTADGDSHLWAIGSGSNYLSYHVATLLALHRFFLETHTSSVPSFLVFDQPSQVYFPEQVRRRGAPPDPEWDKDEDVRAVRKIFEVLGKVVAEAGGLLQVIVLDHAPSQVWGEIPSVTLAADWRTTGDRLVPGNWPHAQP